MYVETLKVNVCLLARFFFNFTILIEEMSVKALGQKWSHWKCSLCSPAEFPKKVK